MAPGVKIIKLFFFVADAASKQDWVLVPGTQFIQYLLQIFRLAWRNFLGDVHSSLFSPKTCDEDESPILIDTSGL